MADNIDIKDAATATRTVATDEIGGVSYQRVKATFGTDGTATDVSAAAPFPTAIIAPEASYLPGYDGPSAAPGQLNVDPGGSLLARAQVLTDEGTFRVNFANSALAVSIPGTPARTGAVITGLTLTGFDLHVGDYFKFDADAESAWTQVDAILSATSIQVTGYTGSATSGAASRSLVDPFTGTGGSMSVASGQLTINSGTTASVRTGVLRIVDYGPLVWRSRFSLSQRVANTDFHAGLAENETLTARWFARFRFTGATNTSVICESGRNPTTAPSASETQSTTVTIPATSSAQEFRIEQFTESVRFYVGSALVAEHTLVIPSQHDEMVGLLKWENTGVPTTSAAVVDYLTVKNHDKLEIGVMSDAEMIGVRAASGPVFAYNVSGVIAINTVLVQLDCMQYQGISVHCHAIGTTGVITPEWSADNTNWTIATVTTVAGADATTLAATTNYLFARAARYFRLRLSTATTAAATTVYVQGLPFAAPTRLATQPVSGTVAVSGSTALTPGTAAANLGKAEDAASASGDTGIFILGVRRDALLISASATADYNEIATNRFGAVLTTDFRLTARTFRAVTAAFSVAASATDIWDLFGNATTTVVVNRIRVWATQTTGGVVALTARVRTTANTTGTRVASTIVKAEQADTISSSAPGHYTANPTVGTDAGAVAGGMAFVGATTATPGFWEFNFGERGKGITLSGTAQGIALALGGVTVTGGSFIVEVEAYEF